MRSQMRKNRVKEMLKSGKPVVGTFLVSRSIANLEILALQGFDFVMIDTEHFMKNPETIEHLIIAAEAAGITPFVRVQDDLRLIDLALSAGARGILVPMCNTREIAQTAVDLAKYAPVGKRGVCNPRAVTYGAGGLQDMFSFFQTENENILILAQVETAQAVQNLDEIISVQGIDVVTIGQVDLSQTMGILCKLDHPRLEETIQRIFKETKTRGIPVGIFAFDGNEATERIRQGFNFVSLANDALFLSQGAAEEMRKVRRA